jgi:hypothetical protein
MQSEFRRKGVRNRTCVWANLGNGDRELANYSERAAWSFCSLFLTVIMPSKPSAAPSGHRLRRVVQLGLVLVGLYILSTVFLHSPPDTDVHLPQDIDGTRTPSRPPPSPRHRYGSDGLLEVNPLGPHPIYELISRGEALWNAKVAKQSTTLKQAVLEYRRRYGRYPPPGFDKWWDYAEKNNVQLRDDYNQIFLSLLGFWGVRPSELRRLRDDWAVNGGGSYTIGKQTKEQKIRVLHATENSTVYTYHSNLQMELIKDIEHFLPPFAATFNPQGELPTLCLTTSH